LKQIKVGLCRRNACIDDIAIVNIAVDMNLYTKWSILSSELSGISCAD